MSDFEAQLNDLLLTLDHTDEKKAKEALDKLQQLFKENELGFYAIVDQLEQNDVLFPSKLSAILRKLDDADDTRYVALSKARKFGGEKPIFGQILNTLNLISLTQQHTSVAQERDGLAQERDDLAKKFEQAQKENSELRQHIKPPLLRRFLTAAQNVFARATSPAQTSTKSRPLAVKLSLAALGVGVGAGCCISPAIMVLTAIRCAFYAMIKQSDVSNGIDVALNKKKIKKSFSAMFGAFALSLLSVSIMPSHPSSAPAVYDRLFNKAAKEMLNGKQISDLRETHFVDSSLWMLYVFSGVVPEETRCVLKKYDTIGDRVLVHVWQNGEIESDRALRYGINKAVIVEETPQQRVESEAYDGARSRAHHDL